MKTSQADQSEEKETGRLEAFSDGVFSIAMTLLVLELKVPPLSKTASAAALYSELAKQWPSYFAFVTSFATVLIMWVNHHAIFRLIRRTSGTLMFANGFLLLLVTAVPFPTALVAMFLRTPAAPAACAVYAGMFVLISIAYGLLLLAARRAGQLLVPGAMPELARRMRDCFLVGTPLYLLAAVTASFSPWICLGICSGLWIYWTTSSIERKSSFNR